MHANDWWLSAHVKSMCSCLVHVQTHAAEGKPTRWQGLLSFYLLSIWPADKHRPLIQPQISAEYSICSPTSRSHPAVFKLWDMEPVPTWHSPVWDQSRQGYKIQSDCFLNSLTATGRVQTRSMFQPVQSITQEKRREERALTAWKSYSLQFQVGRLTEEKL